MTEVVEQRRREQARLIEVARSYAASLAEKLGVLAVVVIGSVARGDFNVWSDLDVVVIADDLPESYLERSDVLMAHAPPGLQPIGFTPEEFQTALRKGNPMAREARDVGITVLGEYQW